MGRCSGPMPGPVPGRSLRQAPRRFRAWPAARVRARLPAPAVRRRPAFPRAAAPRLEARRLVAPPIGARPGSRHSAPRRGFGASPPSGPAAAAASAVVARACGRGFRRLSCGEVRRHAGNRRHLIGLCGRCWSRRFRRGRRFQDRCFARGLHRFRGLRPGPRDHAAGDFDHPVDEMLQLVEHRRGFHSFDGGFAVTRVCGLWSWPGRSPRPSRQGRSQLRQRLAPLPIGCMHARDSGEHQRGIRADIGWRRHIGCNRLACHAAACYGLAGHRLA